MRQLLRSVITSAALHRALAPLTRGRVTFITLHRFLVPGETVRGHAPAMVRRTLAALRRDGVELLSLTEAIARLQDPARPLSRCVVFTVDDGYADFAKVGADVFLEFDCPVTVFLTTGFTSGRCWYWWDQIDHILDATERPAIEVDLGAHRLAFRRDDPAPVRELAIHELREHVQMIPDAERHAIIDAFASAAGVELPPAAPARFAAMSWSDVSSLEARGIGFAPHSVTHPVLPQVSAVCSASEITDSWAELRGRLRAPVPVFAYPNGRFGPREAETVRRSGMVAAVTTRARYAIRAEIIVQPARLMALPRFGCPDTVESIRLLALGGERVAAPLQRVLHHA